MQPVALDEIDNIYDYERKRSTLRPQMMALKKQRSLRLGPALLLTFENRETIRYYIQEAARAERLLQTEALQRLLDEYNAMLPGDNELRATLYLRIASKDTIRETLHLFEGLHTAETIRIALPDGTTIPASFSPPPKTPQPVYHLTFRFDPPAKQSLGKKDRPVSLEIDYRTYQHRAEVSATLRELLWKDLQ